jgi:hypothetical protein
MILFAATPSVSVVIFFPSGCKNVRAIRSWGDEGAVALRRVLEISWGVKVISCFHREQLLLLFFLLLLHHFLKGGVATKVKETFYLKYF